MSKLQNSLLPNHKSDFDKKLDLLFAKRIKDLDTSLVDVLPKSCSKELLNVLAISFDMDISFLDEKEARKLLSEAIKTHYFLGTTYILEDNLKKIFAGCKVVEWFSYGGEPYHFKVEVQNGNWSLNQEFYSKLEKKIEQYKNVRSVLESIDVVLSSRLDKKYALATLYGENISVLPYQKTKLDLKANNKYAVVLTMVEAITLRLKLGDL